MEHVHYLDEELMEDMCHTLAKDFFDSIEEPIPEFGGHDHNLLDSALNLPRQTFGNKELYPGLNEKAAALYYSLNKNHPFKNGNKRIATASLVVFLFINDRILLVSKEDLLHKTLSIAQSDPKDRGKILIELDKWIKKCTVSKEEYKDMLDSDPDNRIRTGRK